MLAVCVLAGAEVLGMALHIPRPPWSRALNLPCTLAAALTAVVARTVLCRPAPARIPNREGLVGQELESQVHAVYLRVMRRLQYAEAVRAGRMSLLEAASRNVALSRQPPRFHWETFRMQYAGLSDEELLRRYVIEMATTLMAYEDPGKARDLREALERELEAHLHRGPLVLPKCENLSSN